MSRATVHNTPLRPSPTQSQRESSPNQALMTGRGNAPPRTSIKIRRRRPKASTPIPTDHPHSPPSIPLSPIPPPSRPHASSPIPTDRPHSPPMFPLSPIPHTPSTPPSPQPSTSHDAHSQPIPSIPPPPDPPQSPQPSTSYGPQPKPSTSYGPQPQPSPPPRLPLHSTSSVYKNLYKKYIYKISNHHNPETFFRHYKEPIIKLMKEYFNKFASKNVVKVFSELEITLLKRVFNAKNSAEYEPFYLILPNQLISSSSITSSIEQWSEYLNRELEERLNVVEGSGFIVHSVNSFHIAYAKIGVANTLGSFDYPRKEVRGCTNIFIPSGYHDACIVQSMAAFFIARETDPQRLRWANIAQRVNNLNTCARYVCWKSMSFPIVWENISALERMNNVAIYIYGLQNIEKSRWVVFLSRMGCKKYKLIIPLLLLNGQHACLIKDFNNFIRSVTRDSSEKSKENGYRYCHTCFESFSDDNVLHRHEVECDLTVKTKFLPEGSKLKFSNPAKSHPYSHICIFDLEAGLTETNDIRHGVESIHKSIAYAYVIISREGKIVSKSSYAGENCADLFMDDLLNEWDRLRNEKPDYKIQMTQDDVKDFEFTSLCQLCNAPFSSSSDKHKHHDHSIAGPNYIGTYCGRCNRACRDSYSKLPVFAHNCSYDVGLILKELQNKHDFRILTKQGLKIQKLVVDFKLVFMDSLAFLNGSLGNLAKEFFRDGHKAKFCHELLSHIKDAALREEFVSGKLPMCYEHIRDINTLNETSLPSKDKFYNRLRKEHLSDIDYGRAERVWDIGECITLKDFLINYLLVDVGLLADILWHWRTILFNKYKLEMCRYISLPSFAFDAFLKVTLAELDHITDCTVYNLIRSNIRGGFTSVVRQYTVANNKFINPDFREGVDVPYFISYLDFNSLYAGAMKNKLPKGGIRALNQSELSVFINQDLQSIRTDSCVGYWLVIDSEPISPETARRTDEFPLCLTHKVICEEDLSPYSRACKEAEGLKMLGNNKKLVASHTALQNHLISLPLLQLFMSLGMEIRKIHTVFEFQQEAYMAPFIDLNIESRVNAKSSIEKSAFKAMSNSVFGKTLMNVLKYSVKSNIVSDEKTFLNKVRSPRLRSILPLRENRVITSEEKSEILINLPNYIGFQILEIAKFTMYNFFYKTLKETYQDKVKLIYTDTDSLILRFETSDINKEFAKAPLNAFLDTSNFDKDHHLYSETNKGKLGLLKSETGSKLIREVVALRPKMYSILMEDDTRINRIKGIPLNEHAKITHDRYKKILEDHKLEKITIRNIRNVKGQIATTKSEKVTLSSFDCKRFHVDAQNSYAYGHPNSTNLSYNPLAKQTNPPSSPPPFTPFTPGVQQPQLYSGLWSRREEQVEQFFTPNE